jgi:hypothetical protein
MLLATRRGTRPHFRLFVVGRKKLPEVRRGETHAEERNWAANILTAPKTERVREELLAREYNDGDAREADRRRGEGGWRGTLSAGAASRSQ